MSTTYYSKYKKPIERFQKPTMSILDAFPIVLGLQYQRFDGGPSLSESCRGIGDDVSDDVSAPIWVYDALLLIFTKMRSFFLAGEKIAPSVAWSEYVTDLSVFQPKWFGNCFSPAWRLLPTDTFHILESVVVCAPPSFCPYCWQWTKTEEGGVVKGGQRRLTHNDEANEKPRLLSGSLCTSLNTLSLDKIVFRLPETLFFFSACVLLFLGCFYFIFVMFMLYLPCVFG